MKQTPKKLTHPETQLHDPDFIKQLMVEVMDEDEHYQLQAQQDWKTYFAAAAEVGLAHLLNADVPNYRVMVHFARCPKCQADPNSCLLTEILQDEVGGCSACEICENLQWPLERLVSITSGQTVELLTKMLEAAKEEESRWYAHLEQEHAIEREQEIAWSQEAR